MKIELQALEHAYPGGDKALDGVDLTLDGNEPVAIIGQNGAGRPRWSSISTAFCAPPEAKC